MKCLKCQSDNPDTDKFCRECGTNITHPDDAQPSFTRTLETPVDGLTRGTLFADRYEVIEKLGEGGMGAVYRVEDTKVGEEVALKLINPLVASDNKTIERFRNELKFARKIRHKHVCQMFDLGESDETRFITMEYVAGEDLKSLLRRTGKLTIEMGARVAKQMAEGLTEAHSVGIIHRDLKPSNIMVDEMGNARIMDFGIARSKQARGITGAGLVIGTPEYMSPEQAEGKEADSRSDIYSLGVILFEMFTGQRPFEGDSALGVAMKHKGEEPREPWRLNPNIPESINKLVLKCLKKDPVDRFQNTEEILKEITAIDIRLPETKTRERQKSGFISKEITVSFSLRKFLLPVLIFVLVIAAGLFIWRPWTPKKVSVTSSGKPSLAIVNFRNISGDSEIDKWKTHFPEYLMADLRQSKHINVMDQIKIYSILQELDLLESENYSEADLINICEKGYASHILTGIVLKAEHNNEVQVTLYRADTLEKLGTEEVEAGSDKGLPAMVDQLTPKIKNLFGLTEAQVAEDIDMNIGEIRPKSEEAYEFFARGYKAHQMLNDYEQAIELFKKALDLEPEFGYGWICLSTSYFNIGRTKEAKYYAEKAMEFKGRMSVREMNHALARLYQNSEKTLDKTFEAFQEILKDYPDDLEANSDMGFFHWMIEEWDETIKFCGNVWKSGFRDTSIPYKYFAIASSAIGSYAKAEECLNFFLENIEEHAAIRSQLALIHLCQGDYDQALLEIEKDPKTNPNLYYLYAAGRLMYSREDFAGAEQAFKKRIKSQNTWIKITAFADLHNSLIAQGRFKEARAHLRSGISFFKRNPADMYLPDLYLCLLYNFIKAGQAEEALDAFDESWEAAHNAGNASELYMRQMMYFKGIALLEREDIEEAVQITASLKELIDSGKNRKAIRLFYHLSGLIEERNGNFEKALAYFSDALKLAPFEHDYELYYRLDRAPYLDSLGAAYFKMGELDKAIEQFEKIQDLTLGRLDYGDIYAKSYYVLGKIFEEKGWQGKAIESYEKFLELWKAADPSLPDMADARERLSCLKQIFS